MAFDYTRYQRERYSKTKNQSIDYLGGKCKSCGSKENLHFDHIDPASKKYTLSTMFSKYSWESILKELQKCQLLCRSCHELKTASEFENRIPWNKNTKKLHGSYYEVYTLKCRCAECQTYREDRLMKRKLGVSPRPPKSLKE